jgi:prolipoprotein diacylglyceryltransferase
MNPYSVWVISGIVIVVIVVLWYTPFSHRHTFDVCISMLLGGLLLGRLVHVILQWGYYAYHVNEAFETTLSGIDWRGACVGALIFGWGMAKFRGIAYARFLELLTWVVPLLGITGWAGCGQIGCAYGQEVPRLTDFSPLLVWDAYDIYGIFVPRFSTQPLGIGLLVLWLGVLLVIQWGGWLLGRRFAIALLGLALIMFGLGFLRGDSVPRIANLRADQCLDLAIVIGCIVWLMSGFGSSTTSRNPTVPVQE